MIETTIRNNDTPIDPAALGDVVAFPSKISIMSNSYALTVAMMKRIANKTLIALFMFSCFFFFES